ncbi:MAG: hypothetical protein OXG97_10415 [Candidatus Poribacteria bacterium]|nr:hypothetical protein [Candidatus Poribacteria bacterium]
MKKGVCVGVIFCFITITHLYGMTVEERAFREELETRAEMDISHEEYQEALAKILEPKEGWDADLRYVLFPFGFDEVWYGHKPCDAETLADYRNLLQKVYARY